MASSVCRSLPRFGVLERSARAAAAAAEFSRRGLLGDVAGPPAAPVTGCMPARGRRCSIGALFSAVVAPPCIVLLGRLGVVDLRGLTDAAGLIYAGVCTRLGMVDRDATANLSAAVAARSDWTRSGFLPA